ncbi:MAG: carbohydrate ABC transporter substrate-binding protein [Bauldia sp.]|nr:MAG: carbohydrate ABC transporter substrate-binding protein [Bauldia sp.]
MKAKLFGAAAAIVLFAAPAAAADCEVTHWWTSGGEAAAVAEFAKAFDALGGGDKWVDGAIGGSGDTARPIIISRIMGGNPPCATQFNPGKDADDLIAAGLMQDLTELATKEGWYDIVRPKSQIEGCTVDGKVYCVPVNLHSAQWMWTNRHVYQDAGIEPPKNWDDVVAAAPKLSEKGILPLSMAQGWPVELLLVRNMVPGIGGPEIYLKIYRDKDVDAAGGPEMRKVFEAMDQARKIVDPATIVPQWNDAVSLVITGKAGANVMGDWAQGEFQVANMVAGEDYDCIPGMGYNPLLNTGGDVFFFPKNSDPAVTAAQMKLASAMISKPVQVSFNLKKGSLPIRADVDLAAANACMKIGLKILDDPKNIIPDNAQLMDRDTINQIRDLLNEFFTDPEMTVDAVQASFVDIIASAPK